LTRNIGINGVEKPSRSCDDKKCPYHGTVSVRGLILDAKVSQLRATRMAVVEREYTFYNKKYQRYERRRSRIHAHLPACLDIKEGDLVLIGETRPLAKSVSFVILGRRS